jgi:hypothetical protein
LKIITVLDQLIQPRSLKVAPVTEKMRSDRLAWYGQIMRRDESHTTKSDEYERRWAP